MKLKRHNISCMNQDVSVIFMTKLKLGMAVAVAAAPLEGSIKIF